MSTPSFTVTTFLFLSVWFLCTASGYKCPPPAALYPCQCERPDHPIIRCKNLTQMETINEIFKQSSDLRFKYFILVDSTLMFLPASSLVSKRFYGLMIKRTKLIGLFDAMPSSSNTVAVFSLEEVVIQRGIKWEYVQKFSKLENLQLIKINIKILGKDFAKNVPSGLKHLSMMHTNTTKLADGVFARLDNIYGIMVANNSIREVKRNMFSRPCPIRSFDFPDNMIESLPDDIFTDMPHLKAVGLQNNRISLLKESLYGPVFGQLMMLSLNKNPIICDCRIAWLISSNSRKVSGFCEEPIFRKGIQIKSLTEEDFEYCKDD